MTKYITSNKEALKFLQKGYSIYHNLVDPVVRNGCEFYMNNRKDHNCYCDEIHIAPKVVKSLCVKFKYKIIKRDANTEEIILIKGEK